MEQNYIKGIFKQHITRSIFSGQLDLFGHTLIVKSAKVNGVKLTPSTYAAGDAAVAGFVVDSATGWW